MKGCLIALAIFVVIVVLFVVGIVLFVKSKAGDFESMRIEIEEEVKEFSATADSQDCLDEALSRLPEGGDILSNARNVVFLGKCLEAAEYTSGFCDDVPDEDKIGVFKSGVWRLNQCGANNPNLQECQKLWGQVADFCSERKGN